MTAPLRTVEPLPQWGTVPVTKPLASSTLVRRMAPSLQSRQVLPKGRHVELLVRLGGLPCWEVQPSWEFHEEYDRLPGLPRQKELVVEYIVLTSGELHAGNIGAEHEPRTQRRRRCSGDVLVGLLQQEEVAYMDPPSLLGDGDCHDARPSVAVAAGGPASLSELSLSHSNLMEGSSKCTCNPATPSSPKSPHPGGGSIRTAGGLPWGPRRSA
mmetsp:Transcript_65148/g.139539  ORF Transcript_65148/g.139539 Transcript_65148/m.139539 type:complete len:212 (-) Transcript_65148:14-649(-)